MRVTIPTRPHACVVCGGRDHTVVATGTDYQYRTTDQQFRWCECKICGHLYIDPIPSEDALALIYPETLKNYADFDANPGLAFRVKAYLDGRRLRKLAKDLPDGGRLLDVGCAAGMLLDVAKRHCPNLHVLDGLEISEAAAAGAKQKGYRVQISTIENADLPDAYYDLVVMQQVIEHVHDPRAVLRRIRSTLRPGGRLVMDTPNLYSWDHRLFGNGYWEGYHIPRHFNLWTTEGMARIAREAGFTSISFRKRIKPVHWTLSLQNWAVGTGKRGAVTRFFDLRNPLLLIPFGVVDAMQLALFDKASDIQYVAVK
jgi:2-polyprenyl-3-methyl-5-hydroxy-6-metoxy-1,4-benzoquinol methylase